jgi:ribonucleoside-diphosphate reductase alpha chain
MIERPRSIPGYTTAIETGCGTLLVTINEGPDSEGKVYKEVMLEMGKSGGCQACMMEGVGKLLTWAWTSGTAKKNLIRSLRGIQCPNIRVSDSIRTLSCLDAIAIVLAAGNKPLSSVPPVATPEEVMAARPTADITEVA